MDPEKRSYVTGTTHPGHKSHRSQKAGLTIPKSYEANSEFMLVEHSANRTDQTLKSIDLGKEMNIVQDSFREADYMQSARTKQHHRMHPAILSIDGASELELTEYRQKQTDEDTESYLRIIEEKTGKKPGSSQLKRL